MHDEFTIPAYLPQNESLRDATAERFGRFARAAFLAASSNVPIHVRPGPDAEPMRRAAMGQHKSSILSLGNYLSLG